MPDPRPVGAFGGVADVTGSRPRDPVGAFLAAIRGDRGATEQLGPTPWTEDHIDELRALLPPDTAISLDRARRAMAVWEIAAPYLASGAPSLAAATEMMNEAELAAFRAALRLLDPVDLGPLAW